MIFDTHAHLDSVDFENDLGSVVKNLLDSGVNFVVDPGCDLPTSKKSIELSSKYDFIYSAIGFHPHEAKYMNDEAYLELEYMSKIPKVVAIGEIGLDYYYEYSDRKTQKNAFIKQILLSKKLNLPFIIHSRDASEDTYEILREYKKDSNCVLHCFSQSKEMAKLYLDLGCFLSFAGPVTFKNSTNLKEIAQYVPIDRLFIETDSPYLSPEPKRGKRNTPSNVIYIGKEIARLKKMDEEDIFNITCENAKKFFNII